MKKSLLISLISLICFSQISARQNPYAFKIFHPDFIRINSEFQISLIASDQLLQYDEISLLIYSDDNLKLVKSSLKNTDVDEILGYTAGRDHQGPESFRINIPAKFLKLSDKIFQLNLKFKAPDIIHSEILFAMETVKKDPARELDKSAPDEIWEYELPSVELKFYDPSNASGKSAVIENNSKIILEFPDKYFSDNLLISFWGRTNTNLSSFFKIVDKISREKIFSISKTQFGIVKVPGDLTDFDFSEFYVSENSYNLYSVLLSAVDQSASLYINGKPIYSTPSVTNYPLDQLAVEFCTDSSSFLEIDEVKVIDLNDNIAGFFKNIHYKTFTLDSSQVIYSQNFDVEYPSDLISPSEKEKLKFDNIRLVDSEVPLFSRTPELRAASFETFYELTWNNMDDVNVNSYEIEKSLDGKTYQTLSSVLSLNDPANVYYFVDTRNQLDEVVYYRIKQLNKDGSTNYSTGIKLGSAQIDYFNIEQNYPNPFNPVTSVSVEVFFESEFEITVYDLVGTKVDIIHKGPLSKGVHVFPFDGSNLTSGIYIFEVASPFSNQAIKMILTK